MKQVKSYPVYGVMAEYDSTTEIIAATRKAFDAGYRVMDAFTPFPIEAVSEMIGFQRHHNKVPFATLIGGLLGGIGGFSLACLASAVWYPLNIAGRPFITWPMYIPVTFESTILIAGLSCGIGMLAMNGLPQPYHPVFNVPSFSLATNNRFFLCIEARDPNYDESAVTDFLRTTGAREVVRVDG
ncbi:MAG: DUF3341 domain-containing protein [Bacteroidota bacterium]|nr:DUF3341 domain-containing protein [Bacteroidota bacterium]MDP4234619.1 DUF3341 domain-containing protein [Bacteroidota bacterium]MDP4243782.1 DUF3341 domain-containing protein [Bacteroidota bacterium]MDP4288980.1 DUF3341 domain-containing protein [Bacteroidota bacterium]